MKNWILSLACLFVIGSQVCLGAEKRTESKNPMFRVKTGAPVKKHSNKGRQATPHGKKQFKYFAQLRKLEPAMAQMLVDVNPKIAEEPEKPRVKLNVSTEKPAVETTELSKDSLAPLRDGLAESFAKVVAQQRTSLTPLQESLLELDSETDADLASCSPVSPVRDLSPSMWPDVAAKRERSQTSVFMRTEEDIQEDADELKMKLEDVHSKHVARTRSRTAVSE